MRRVCVDGGREGRKERGNMEERKETTSVIKPPAVQHQLGKGQKSRGNGLYAIAKDKCNYEFSGHRTLTFKHSYCCDDVNFSSSSLFYRAPLRHVFKESSPADVQVYISM